MGLTNGRETVTINEACARSDVSRRTLYNCIAKGKVDYVRTAGGSIRIFSDTLWTRDVADADGPRVPPARI